MTQVAFRPQGTRNPAANSETAADWFYSAIVEKAVTLAAMALEVCKWKEIDAATFDACDRIVRETGSIGNMNKSHLRHGYNPPADISIIDTLGKSQNGGLVALLEGNLFTHNVPALVNYRDSMLRCAMDLGALTCHRMRSHGEKPPQWAVDKFKVGH